MFLQLRSWCSVESAKYLVRLAQEVAVYSLTVLSHRYLEGVD